MKMTKGDYVAFLSDDTFWPDGWCHDETLFRIDGQEVEEVDAALPDSTVIVIVDGIVADADITPIRSLKAHARRWQKAQSVRQVVIEVPREIDDKALRQHLKAIGASLHTPST